MQTYLNQGGIPLSVAAYLASDHYDYIPNTISTTALIKPIRQQILKQRVPAEQQVIDLTQIIKSRLGTSIHDGVERTWVEGHYKQAMLSLGYPAKVIDRIVVNPRQLLEKYGYSPESLNGLRMHEGPLPKNPIPIYLEIRGFRDIEGHRISGKFDLVAEGRLEDNKCTGTFTWLKDNKTEDFQLQGSIYRWLHEDLITEPEMAIQFFFWDWMAARATQSKDYPAKQVEQKLIPLLPLNETETYVRDKLKQFRDFRDSPDEDIPLCTDKDLWRREASWKYYRNPNTQKRASGSYDNLAEAQAHLAKDGHVGEIVHIPGEVVACHYCAAFPICKQKDQLIADGSLKI